jgi:predicted membrane protein
MRIFEFSFIKIHMRMASGLFWGIVLMLIGLGIVIRIVFNVDLPIFKLLVAFFFIWLGLRIMMGNHGILHFHATKNDVLFNENSFKDINKENKEYNVVFGKAVYDFRELDVKEKTTIHMNTIFGGAEIKLKKGSAYRIAAESVFGGIKLPNGNTSAFGNTHYQSENFNADSAHLFIKAEIVFGGIEIQEFDF